MSGDSYECIHLEIGLNSVGNSHLKAMMIGLINHMYLKAQEDVRTQFTLIVKD